MLKFGQSSSFHNFYQGLRPLLRVLLPCSKAKRTQDANFKVIHSAQTLSYQSAVMGSSKQLPSILKIIDAHREQTKNGFGVDTCSFNNPVVCGGHAKIYKRTFQENCSQDEQNGKSLISPKEALKKVLKPLQWWCNNPNVSWKQGLWTDKVITVLFFLYF